MEYRFYFVEEEIFNSVFKIHRMKVFLRGQKFAKFNFILLVLDLIFFLNTVNLAVEQASGMSRHSF